MDRHSQEKRKAYQRKYQLAWSRSRRLAWLKANGPCRQCGSRVRLEVDHVDPTRKVTHRIWSLSPQRREAELRRCQVLCRRCHLTKTGAGNRMVRLGRPGRPSKLTEREVFEILSLRQDGATYAALASRFGVHKSTIIRIVSGEIWGWRTRPGSDQLPLFVVGA
jgi:5-methylcytosine-specific restriction endonuclease McrA